MKKQEGSLNLLKLLAASIIVFHHFQQLSGASFPGRLNFAGGSFYWGYMVELFFMLSGYFTLHYLEDPSFAEKGYFRFIFGKYLRFLPLLALTGAVTAIVLYLIARSSNAAYSFNLWTVILGMTGLGRLFTEKIVINNPTWYISVLLICYSVFYFTVYVSGKMKIDPGVPFFVTMWIGVLMFHVCNKYDFAMPLFSRSIGRGLICFFAGLLLCRILKEKALNRKPLWQVGSLLYLILFILVYRSQGVEPSDVRYYLLSFTIFPAVILLFKFPLLEQLCSHSCFRAIGNITFHTFMWHYMILQLLLFLFEKFHFPYKNMKTMLLCLGVSLLVGALSAGAEKLIRGFKTTGRKNEENKAAETKKE